MAKEAGPQINWVGAAGSGLGSVTSAVLLSTTGAAGTWIGAGIGTFIITVGGAIYGYYLQRAKTGIEKTADKMKQGGASKKNARQDTTSISAQRDPNDKVSATSALEADGHTGSQSLQQKVKPTFKEALKNIRWKRVAGLAAGLFALTMAIIFIFELATGRPVSSYTGGNSSDSTGTSITGVQDPAAPADGDPEQAPVPQDEQPEQPEQPGEVVPEEGPEQAPELPEDNIPPPVVPEPQPVPEQPAPQPQPQDENVEAPQ